MLLKNLKKIIKEADEAAAAPAAGAEGAVDGATPKTVTPPTPARAVQAVKDSGDGIGNEATDLAGKLGEKLRSILPIVGVKVEIKVEDASIFILGFKANATLTFDNLKQNIDQIFKQYLDEVNSKLKTIDKNKSSYSLSFNQFGDRIVITVTKN